MGEAGTKRGRVIILVKVNESSSRNHRVMLSGLLSTSEMDVLHVSETGQQGGCRDRWTKFDGNTVDLLPLRFEEWI